jgi:hypothetical protein
MEENDARPLKKSFTALSAKVLARLLAWSGRLDNDSGNRNKKRRVSKVLSSSSSKSKYMQTSHPVNAARFATGVLSMKLRFICPRAPGHLNTKTAQHPLKQ